MHDYNHHPRPKRDIHKHEEYLQWREYERDIGDIAECPRCHKYIAWDEIVSNYEKCDDWFDDMCEEDVLRGLI